jgi:hypothetical protein
MGWRSASLAKTALIVGFLTASSAGAFAQPFIHWEHGGTAAAVKKLSIAQLKDNWVVTGFRNADDNIEMVSWENTSSKLAKRYGVIVTGGIIDVKLTDLDSSHVLAAMIRPDNALELRVWHVDSNGKLTREGEAFGLDPVQTVEVAAIGAKQVVTAVTDSGGRLNVAAWQITSSGDIVLEGSVTDVAVTQATVASVGNGEVLVGARISVGDLLMESWSVTPGGAVTFLHHLTAGGIGGVDISGGAGYAFTGLRNASGKIEVIYWNLDASGNIIRQMSASSESVKTVAISANVTVAEDSSGNLTTGTWDNIDTFEQDATASHGKATLVSIAPISSGQVATASRNSAGDLEVDVWSYGIIH